MQLTMLKRRVWCGMTQESSCRSAPGSKCYCRMLNLRCCLDGCLKLLLQGVCGVGEVARLEGDNPLIEKCLNS